MQQQLIIFRHADMPEEYDEENRKLTYGRGDNIYFKLLSEDIIPPKEIGYDKVLQTSNFVQRYIGSNELTVGFSGPQERATETTFLLTNKNIWNEMPFIVEVAHRSNDVVDFDYFERLKRKIQHIGALSPLDIPPEELSVITSELEKELYLYKHGIYIRDELDDFFNPFAGIPKNVWKEEHKHDRASMKQITGLKSFLDDILKNPNYKNILIVTHGYITDSIPLVLMNWENPAWVPPELQEYESIYNTINRSECLVLSVDGPRILEGVSITPEGKLQELYRGNEFYEGKIIQFGQETLNPRSIEKGT